MVTWRHRFENVTVVERWSEQRQAEEIKAFEARLNELGADCWEMLGFETIPLTGRFSNQVKGNVYLTFFRRPKAA